MNQPVTPGACRFTTLLCTSHHAQPLSMSVAPFADSIGVKSSSLLVYSLSLSCTNWDVDSPFMCCVLRVSHLSSAQHMLWGVNILLLFSLLVIFHGSCWMNLTATREHDMTYEWWDRQVTSHPACLIHLSCCSLFQLVSCHPPFACRQCSIQQILILSSITPRNMWHLRPHLHSCVENPSHLNTTQPKHD
jgi:hypothetical protein